MLIEELDALAANPITWGAVAILTVFAITSVVHRFICPFALGTANISEEEARAAADRPFAAGPRFLMLMGLGIAATLVGLSFISKGVYPALAFYLLFAGVFVIQTEPSRLQLREAQLRVVAAGATGSPASEAAIARLRIEHRWLIALQFAILAAVVVFLLAF